mgnify:FL=1|jgi:hypothetical protein
MIIDTKLARAFNEAVTNLDNIHMGTQEGEINWNFVDADCYMAMTAGNPLFDTREEGQAYVDQFNYLADCFLGEITLADRLQDEYPNWDRFDGVLPVTNEDLILDPSKPAYLVRVK